MLRFIRKLLFPLYVMALFFLSTPVAVFAQSTGLSKGDDPWGLTQLQELIVKFINLIVPVALLAMVVMLSWSGIKFLTSAGEPEGIKNARQTATWAVVGILFLIIAWLALQLIVNFTGQKSLLNFCLQFNGSCS